MTNLVLHCPPHLNIPRYYNTQRPFGFPMVSLIGASFFKLIQRNESPALEPVVIGSIHRLGEGL